MTLEALYFISQVIAAVALVGSLIFVGLQIRESRKQAEHAERTARAQVHQQIADSFRDIGLEWGRRPDVFHRMLMNTKSEDLSPELRMDSGVLLYPTLKVGENAFFQSENGLLSREHLDQSMTLIVNILGSNVGRDWWRDRKRDFNSEFVAYIDEYNSLHRSFQDFEFYQLDEPNELKPELKEQPQKPKRSE